ncbi:hypothetical protein SMUG_05330 [Gallibacterium anatis]
MRFAAEDTLPVSFNANNVFKCRNSKKVGFIFINLIHLKYENYELSSYRIFRYSASHKDV